jgi:hypothetical protein
MSGRIDLEEFLDELVSAIDKRLARQEKAVKRLEAELSALRKSRQRAPDSAVMRVLRGQ